MEKKKTIIAISATLALILLVATATFAYFQADLGNNKEVDVTVSTVPQTDLLSFSVGDPISLQADETSFVKGGDSASATTNVKALLTAGGGTAIKYYYVYLLISGNDFIYTQDENTPELILTVKKPDGTELTSIDGLTYKTVTDGKGTTIKGFDITTKKGLITIANNKKITTTSTIEEQWDVTVTLVNYDINQINNIRKNFTSKLLIQQGEFIYSPATACTSGQSLNTCIISLNGFVDTLYYHDSSLTNGAGDNSYRYAGASDSVNNYICLGSDATTCPAANLFRIIGVFGDQTKVIRAKSTGTQKWDKYAASKSAWSSSSLIVYLNGEYLTNLTFKDKIADTLWKVGGYDSSNLSYMEPATLYKYEVGANASTTTVNKKIGLMYVSDYAFAASPSAWTKRLDLYSANTSNNWLYLGSKEWTITRNGIGSSSVFSVDKTGDIIGSSSSDSFDVRPSFNLNSVITYVSGSGSATNPIRIN